jgi:hypothetical protein
LGVRGSKGIVGGSKGIVGGQKKNSFGIAFCEALGGVARFRF